MIGLISLIVMIQNNQVNHLNHGSGNSSSVRIGSVPKRYKSDLMLYKRSIFVIVGKNLRTVERFQNRAKAPCNFPHNLLNVGLKPENEQTY